MIPGEMFGRQLRERDPEEEDSPGAWGRAGSGKGETRVRAERGVAARWAGWVAGPVVSGMRRRGTRE